MNTQPSLFDSPEKRAIAADTKEFIEQFRSGSSRHSDPPTSKAAARSVDTNHLEALVVEAMRRHPSGMTSHEVAAYLDLSLVTVSPRFRPLVNKNIIIDSGEKRAGVGFRNSIVWKAK